MNSLITSFYDIPTAEQFWSSPVTFSPRNRCITNITQMDGPLYVCVVDRTIPVHFSCTLISLFKVTLSSCVTLFVLHFVSGTLNLLHIPCGALVSCYFLSILNFFHVALFPGCTFFVLRSRMLHSFQFTPFLHCSFSCCIFLIMHIFLKTLFSCYSLLKHLEINATC